MAMKDMIPLHFVTGGLGISIFRRKRKRGRVAKKGGES